MTRKELIQKTVIYLNKWFTKFKLNEDEIKFCKAIQDQRIAYRLEWNYKHPQNYLKNSRISRWHDDKDLWWGLACELVLARVYGSANVLKSWAEDQIRQNEQLRKEGHFDSKDIGHTQVRSAEYSETEPRRLIYRQNDFYTKSNQPVVACVINTDPKDIWAMICGFMSWEDLKARKQEFWDDPDQRGFSAMFIPYWKLTPMINFKPDWLV